MAQQTLEKPIHRVARHANRPMRWILLSAAVVVIAAATLWFSLQDESGPTVAFDGQTATYDGPTTFDAGEVTFTFDASAHEPGAAFVVIEITDDGATLEDFKVWADENPATSVPPFGGAFWANFATGEDRVIESTMTLKADTRYGVSVNTSPSDTNKAHPVAILEVN